MLSLLVTLVVAGLIFWLVWWFIDYVGVPEPFNKVIRVVIGLSLDKLKAVGTVIPT